MSQSGKKDKAESSKTLQHSPVNKICVVCDGIPNKDTVRCGKCTRWYHKGCAEYNQRRSVCGTCEEIKSSASAKMSQKHNRKCYRCDKEMSESKDAVHKGKSIKICLPCHNQVVQDKNERRSIPDELKNNDINKSNVDQTFTPPPINQSSPNVNPPNAPPSAIAPVKYQSSASYTPDSPTGQPLLDQPVTQPSSALIITEAQSNQQLSNQSVTTAQTTLVNTSAQFVLQPSPALTTTQTSSPFIQQPSSAQLSVTTAQTTTVNTSAQLVLQPSSAQFDSQPSPALTTTQMSSSLIQQPSSAQFVSQPSTALITGQTSSSLIQQPSSAQLVSQPSPALTSTQTSSSFIQHPSSSQIVSQPSPASTIAHTSSTFIQQPSPSLFITQPLIAPNTSQPPPAQYLTQPTIAPNTSQPSSALYLTSSLLTQPSTTTFISQPATMITQPSSIYNTQSTSAQRHAYINTNVDAAYINQHYPYNPYQLHQYGHYPQLALNAWQQHIQSGLSNPLSNIQTPNYAFNAINHPMHMMPQRLEFWNPNTTAIPDVQQSSHVPATSNTASGPNFNTDHSRPSTKKTISWSANEAVVENRVDTETTNKPNSRSSKCHSESGKKIKNLEREQNELRSIIESCKDKLKELDLCHQQLVSNKASSSQSSVLTLTDDDLLNRTSEWADNLTKHNGRSTGNSEQNHQNKPSQARNIRSSTPALEARSFRQFAQNLLGYGLSEASLNPVNIRLTKEQTLARRIIPTELPPFTGRPEDWPLFISTLVESTEMCGFTDAENIMRLRKSLSGEARQLVQSQLQSCNMLAEILHALRLKYGKPYQLLDIYFDKLKKVNPIESDNAVQLINYSLLVRDLFAAIKLSNIDEHLTNPMLVRELIGKLSSSQQIQYGQYQKTSGVSDVETFANWLFDIADIAGEMPCANLRKTESREKKMTGRVYATDLEKSSDTKLSCPVCEKEHRVDKCEQFLEKTVDERWSMVLKMRLCGLCLKRHDYRMCRTRYRCPKCKRRHHELVHGRGESPPTILQSSPVNTHSVKSSATLFRIVPVTLYGPEKQFETYAFLDEGSSVTLLERSVSDFLQLNGTEEELCLKWTGDTNRTELSKRVSLAISSCGGNKRYKMTNVRTISNLNLQQQSLNVAKVSKERPHLSGVPVDSYENAIPTMLIGLQHWSLAVPLDVRESFTDTIIATKSRLGWSIFGCLGVNNSGESVNVHKCECECDDNLERLVKQFFSLEYFGVRSSEFVHESNEIIRARNIMKTTLIRLDKRYEIGLLWRYDNISLPDSKAMAYRRLVCLEKRLQHDSTLHEAVHNQIREYEQKAYIKRLSKEEANSNGPRTWYLPLFAVVNPNKPGKVRIVWDAAAKVRNVALNDVLLAGPDLLNPLPDVLRRFRQFEFAVTGDIMEMFHQVRVRKEDWDSQRFLWRDNANEEPTTYVMCVLTFGATCSPSAAQHVKNENAKRFEKVSPRAVKSILLNHYVDDMADSFATIEEARAVTEAVVNIHKDGGFKLRNFVSNVPNIFGESHPQSNTLKSLNMGEVDGTKILGMYWRLHDDSLVFQTHFDRVDPEIINGKRKPTKRELLRIVMMIFDPLGLIQHLIALAKMILQEVWSSNIGWDQPIGETHMVKWLDWLKLLPTLGRYTFPRCYDVRLGRNKEKTTQLHVFVDASENAFAAVAYLRVHDKSEINCVLIGSKTKVAPRKPLSIPRLELQAAVLGCRLAQSIIKSHDIQFNNKTFWSDSTNVLAWINSDAKRYKPFVAFRIGEVLEASETKEWRYVPSKQNVADIATKWRTEQSVAETWMTGPKFLYLEESEWPPFKGTPNKEIEIELRRINVHVAEEHQRPSSNVLATNDWRVMVKRQAMVHRAAYNWLVKVKHVGNVSPVIGKIQVNETQRAETYLFRCAQQAAFNEDIKLLKTNRSLNKNSSLRKLSPMLDEEGVLRMRGRAGSPTSNIKYTPIILPRKHHVTMLIIYEYHRRCHHLFNETVINDLRQLYWIPKMRNTLKMVIKDCIPCRIRKARPQTPIMADLPKQRLAVNEKPFYYTGLDYFGPIVVSVGRRREKRWIAIFTCLTIRAIHIEIAHTLNADSAIMCVRRFVSRRGTPAEIWSDNGTNFTRASSELRELLHMLDKDKLSSAFDNIRWQFIPPSAPHMGGAWERMVRTVKSALSIILPNFAPNDEQLSTALIEIENVINSRPLTYMPLEPDALEAITPNHLIIGKYGGAKTPGIIELNPKLTRKRWIQAQDMADAFWIRWMKEYLPTITRRTKWFESKKEVRLGDIGAIWDTTPRNSWRLGRCVKIIKSGDGKVRQVDLQTSNGILRRPVSKFAVFDRKENGSDPTNTSSHEGGC